MGFGGIWVVELGRKMGFVGIWVINWGEMGFNRIWVVKLGRKTGYRLQRNGIYWDFGSGDWGETGSLGILAIN